jgi:hypothetical protein
MRVVGRSDATSRSKGSGWSRSLRSECEINTSPIPSWFNRGLEAAAFKHRSGVRDVLGRAVTRPRKTPPDTSCLPELVVADISDKPMGII